MNEKWIKEKIKCLVSRPLTMHKGQAGRVAIIAGSVDMIGAALLTCLGAFSVGAGFVYLYTVKSKCDQIVMSYPEIIVKPCDETASGYISSQNYEMVIKEIQKNSCDACAIGPGIGNTKDTAELVSQFVFDSRLAKPCPIVIDADACNVLDVSRLAQLKKETVVCTPHAAEFKRMFPHCDKKEREEQVKQVQQETNQIILLKGHKTLVGSETNMYKNNTGNPGMAVAGMGDVLTGLIAGLCAQGLTPMEAACMGAYLHGLAGDNAYKKFGIGLTPSDCIPEIKSLLK